MVVKIKLKHPGSLFGYHMKEPDAASRLLELLKAIKVWGTGYVIRKLSVLAIYRKHAPPGTSDYVYRQRILADIAGVQKLRNAMTKENRAKNLEIYRQKHAKA